MSPVISKLSLFRGSNPMPQIAPQTSSGKPSQYLGNILFIRSSTTGAKTRHMKDAKSIMLGMSVVSFNVTVSLEMFEVTLPATNSRECLTFKFGSKATTLTDSCETLVTLLT